MVESCLSVASPPVTPLAGQLISFRAIIWLTTSRRSNISVPLTCQSHTPSQDAQTSKTPCGYVPVQACRRSDGASVLTGCSKQRATNPVSLTCSEAFIKSCHVAELHGVGGQKIKYLKMATAQDLFSAAAEIKKHLKTEKKKTFCLRWIHCQSLKCIRCLAVNHNRATRGSRPINAIKTRLLCCV